MDKLKPCPFCGGEGKVYKHEFKEPEKWEARTTIFHYRSRQMGLYAILGFAMAMDLLRMERRKERRNGRNETLPDEVYKVSTHKISGQRWKY